jgi:hypothetical protein
MGRGGGASLAGGVEEPGVGATETRKRAAGTIHVAGKANKASEMRARIGSRMDTRGDLGHDVGTTQGAKGTGIRRGRGRGSVGRADQVMGGRRTSEDVPI